MAKKDTTDTTTDQKPEPKAPKVEPKREGETGAEYQKRIGQN